MKIYVIQTTDISGTRIHSVHLTNALAKKALDEYTLQNHKLLPYGHIQEFEI